MTDQPVHHMTDAEYQDYGRRMLAAMKTRSGMEDKTLNNFRVTQATGYVLMALAVGVGRFAPWPFAAGFAAWWFVRGIAKAWQVHRSGRYQ